MTREELMMLFAEAMQKWAWLTGVRNRCVFSVNNAVQSALKIVRSNPWDHP